MTNRTFKESKPVWVAWVNSDLTEGKGYQYPLAVCELEATAIRLGARQDVQGSDACVMEATAYRVNPGYHWYVPGRIIPPTPEDLSKQKASDAKRLVIQKMKDAGLSDEEIKLVSSL